MKQSVSEMLVKLSRISLHVNSVAEGETVWTPFSAHCSPAVSQGQYLCHEAVSSAGYFVHQMWFLSWKSGKQTVALELGNLWNSLLKITSRITMAKVWCQWSNQSLYITVGILEHLLLPLWVWQLHHTWSLFSWVCCLYLFRFVIFEIA